MREIASEPACQHFLKQNSFQFVPELALSDARNTKIVRERIPWLRTSHGKSPRSNCYCPTCWHKQAARGSGSPMRSTRQRCNCLLIVGWLLADCWLTVGWLLADCCLTVGWLLADCWLTVGWLLADYWLTWVKLISLCWPCIAILAFWIHLTMFL